MVKKEKKLLVDSMQPLDKLSNLIKSLEKFEEILGYHFKHPVLLFNALVHPSSKITYNDMDKLLKHHNLTWHSVFKKVRGNDYFNYERLEFFGDKVLSILVAESLITEYQNKPEGELSAMCANLVCRDYCVAIADKISLRQFIINSKTKLWEKERNISSALENSLEAIVAAIYLDGGLGIVKKFVHKFWFSDHGETFNYTKVRQKDVKTNLQEWAQANNLMPIQYNVIQVTGNDHEPEFTVKLEVGSGKFSEHGVGNSKKLAEKDAAQKLLAKVYASS